MAMYFSYSPFSPTSSASSSASSSPNRSPSTSCHATSSYATSSYATSSYQTTSTSSPISITNPCAYPSWPARSSLNGAASSDPYALTTASSYLSDDDLFPAPSYDSSEDSTPIASPKVSARQVLDTAAIRELLLEEGRRKARKGGSIKVASKSRRRGSANGEKRSASARLSPIAEGSCGE